MFYYIYVIVMLLIFLLFNVMTKSNKKMEEKLLPNDFIITQPKMFFWVGICCGIVFFAVTILAIIFPDTAEWWVYPFFIGASILGFLLAYYCKMYYIKVSEDTITYYAVIKKPQTFKFEDITIIKKQFDGISVYCGEKRIFKIETNCVGYPIFIKRLEDKNLIDNISKLSRTSHF